MKKISLEQHLGVVASVLREAHQRHFGSDKCSRTGEAVTWKTPLDELLDREAEAEKEGALDLLEELALRIKSMPKAERERLLAVTQGDGTAVPRVATEGLPRAVREFLHELVIEEQARRRAEWLAWIFEAGPHPSDVLKRLFDFVKRKQPGLIWNMSFRDLGDLWGESHAASHARSKAIFGDERAEWSKPEQSREKMRVSALGNTNRRGGKRPGSNKERKAA